MMKKTEANVKFCKMQILRLQVTKFFDKLDGIGRSELCNALQTAATTSQAEDAINLWLDEHDDPPTPRAIKAIIRTLNLLAPLQSCVHCRYTPGWMLVERIVTTGHHKGEKVPAATPCKCPLGRAIAAKGEQLKAEEKRRAATEPDFRRAATPEEAAILNDLADERSNVH